LNLPPNVLLYYIFVATLVQQLMVLISIPTTVGGSGATTTSFATCVDTKSTVMLEFQGMMEMDGTTWAGNTLGQLSILDGVRATLSRRKLGRRSHSSNY
jgi:hypothetical protein